MSPDEAAVPVALWADAASGRAGSQTAAGMPTLTSTAS